MRTIHKKLVMDEEQNPIAVQIDYEDWLEIERMLEEIRKAEEPKTGKSRFEELLENTRGTWKHGDGLEYQIKIREEWDDR